MCKHRWQLIIPKPHETDFSEGKRLHYAVDWWLSAWKDIHYCPDCKRTAHEINSHRGGMALHYSNLAIEKANKLRMKYELPLLELCKKFLTPTP